MENDVAGVAGVAEGVAGVAGVAEGVAGVAGIAVGVGVSATAKLIPTQ